MFVSLQGFRNQKIGCLREATYMATFKCKRKDYSKRRNKNGAAVHGCCGVSLRAGSGGRNATPLLLHLQGFLGL